MYNPLVSIVIPTYCQPLYIVRAVESAIRQEYGNLEIIVSDDSINDETKEILKSYIDNKRIRYIHNKPRLGRVLNYRNCLYEYANGEWLVNLDGDDYFVDNQFISKAISAIDGDGNVAFTIANGIIKYPDGHESIKKIPHTASPFRKIEGIEYFKNFAHGRGFFHLSILYNVKLARSIDFYRYDILSADVESILRLALMGRVILLDRTVGVWFLHTNNTSSTARLDELVSNTNWVDSVVEFGKKQRKLTGFEALKWRYLVKQQELTGIYLQFLKSQNKLRDKIRFLFNVLRDQPGCFFFPVFIKKSISHLIFKS